MSNNRILHRLQAARLRSGMTFRALSRRTGIRVAQLQAQEISNDISLGDLLRWREALGIPLAEMLADPPEGLSEVNRVRAGLIQLMRSVKSLQQTNLSDAQDAHVQNMNTTLESLMPELEDIRSWPVYGERRSPNSPARIENNIVSTSTFFPEMNSES